jgi:hypothetical protein
MSFSSGKIAGTTFLGSLRYSIQKRQNLGLFKPREGEDQGLQAGCKTNARTAVRGSRLDLVQWWSMVS